MKLHSKLCKIVIVLLIVMLFFPCFVNAADDDINLVLKIKETIAFWYYVMRLIALAVMLIILLFVGIKMAISTIASEKALYKRMLMDWVVGMILVFSIHYIMIGIIYFNEVMVSVLSNIKMESVASSISKEFNLSKYTSASDIEISLYEAVRTRAYDPKLINGTTGMIMYMFLVYYAVRFTLIYLKRYLSVVVLTLMAPAVATSYAINKVLSGKSKIFGTWLNEYFVTIIMQTIHALIYTVFVSTAIVISLNSISGMIIALILLNFMMKADALFRKIFKFSDSKIAENAANTSIQQMANTFKTARNVMIGGAVGGSLMKGVQKTGTKILTKPLTAASSGVISAAMVAKARRDEKKGNGADYDREERKDEEDKDGKMHYVSEETKMENKLKRQQQLEDDLNETEKDLADAKSKRRNNVEEQERYEALQEHKKQTEKQKSKLDKEIDSLLSDEIKTKDLFKAKINNLFDPTNYVEHRRGSISSKEKLRAKRRRTEWTNGKVFARNVKNGRQGVGATFREQLKLENLFGLTKKDKEVAKEGVGMLKSATLGFFGCLAGLPIMVDNPAIGLPILGVGLHNSGKLFGKKIPKRVHAEKDKRRYKWGGYALPKRYAALKTIEQQAREEAQEGMDEAVVSNVKENHKGLYSAILGGFATVGNIASLGMLKNFQTTRSNFMGDVNLHSMKQMSKQMKKLRQQKVRMIEKDMLELMETARENYSQDQLQRIGYVESGRLDNKLFMQTMIEEGMLVDANAGMIIDFGNILIDQSDINVEDILGKLSQLPQTEYDQITEVLKGLAESGNIEGFNEQLEKIFLIETIDDQFNQMSEFLQTGDMEGLNEQLKLMMENGELGEYSEQLNIISKLIETGNIAQISEQLKEITTGETSQVSEQLKIMIEQISAGETNQVSEQLKTITEQVSTGEMNQVNEQLKIMMEQVSTGEMSQVNEQLKIIMEQVLTGEIGPISEQLKLVAKSIESGNVDQVNEQIQAITELLESGNISPEAAKQLTELTEIIKTGTIEEIREKIEVVTEIAQKEEIVEQVKIITELLGNNEIKNEEIKGQLETLVEVMQTGDISQIREEINVVVEKVEAVQKEEIGEQVKEITELLENSGIKNEEIKEQLENLVVVMKTGDISQIREEINVAVEKVEAVQKEEIVEQVKEITELLENNEIKNEKLEKQLENLAVIMNEGEFDQIKEELNIVVETVQKEEISERVQTIIEAVDNTEIKDQLKQLLEETETSAREEMSVLIETTKDIQKEMIQDQIEMITSQIVEEREIEESKNNRDDREIIDIVTMMQQLKPQEEKTEEVNWLEIESELRKQMEVKEEEQPPEEDDRKLRAAKKAKLAEEEEELRVKSITGKAIDLKTDSVTKAIDDAIIQIAQEQKQLDISELSLDSSGTRNEVIKKMERILEQRGIKDANVDLSSMIGDVDSKLKDRKAVLDKGKTTVVEQTMVKEAFQEVMQESKITDPKEMTVDNIMKVVEKATEKRNEFVEAAKPEHTKGTEDVISKMQGYAESSENTKKAAASIVDMVQAMHANMQVTQLEKEPPKEIVQELREREKKRILNDPAHIISDLQEKHSGKYSSDTTNTTPTETNNGQVPNKNIKKTEENKPREDLQHVLDVLIENRREGLEVKVELGESNKNKNKSEMAMPIQDERKAGDRKVDETKVGDRRISKRTTGDRAVKENISADMAFNTSRDGSRSFNANRAGDRVVGKVKTPNVDDLISLMYERSKIYGNGE